MNSLISSRPHSFKEWLKQRTAIKGNAWKFAELFFSTLVVAGPLTRSRFFDGIIKRAALMTEKHPSAGFSVPLHVDLSSRGEKVALPINLLKEEIRRASFRAVINRCVCRHTFDCKSYSHEFGCLFLGPGAHVVVDNGIAREVTAEEACSHVDKAAELGLAAGAFWVEVEQYVWGFKDKDRERHLEICFCCSCCCGAFKFEVNAAGRTKHLLHQSLGWSCEVDDGCVNCGTCVQSCPRKLISQGVTKAMIHPDCGGCGMCVSACKQQALHVVQVKPAKEKLTDYFEGLDLRL